MNIFKLIRARDAIMDVIADARKTLDERVMDAVVIPLEDALQALNRHIDYLKN